MILLCGIVVVGAMVCAVAVVLVVVGGQCDRFALASGTKDDVPVSVHEGRIGLWLWSVRPLSNQ